MDQLGADQAGDLVVDRRLQEDDVVLQQPAVEVVGPLAAARLLDDVGNQVVHGIEVHGRASSRVVVVGVVVVVIVVVIVVVVVVVVVIVIVVVVVVVVVVSMAEHEVTIDRLAVGVDDLDVVQQPVERLRLADLGDQVGRRRRSARTPCGRRLAFWPTCIADPGVLGVEVVVVDLDRLGVGDGAQGEVDLDRLLATGRAAPSMNGVRVLAGGRQPLLEVDALGLELADGVLHPRTAARRRPSTRAARCRRARRAPRSTLGDQLLAGLVELAARRALARCDARPLLDGVELAEVLGDPLVGELGQRPAPAPL